MADSFKQFQDTMIAAAFAEAGEHERARQILRPGKNSHKKIMLATDEALLHPQALNYALGMCARMGAGLEVVQVFPVAESKEGKGRQDIDALRLEETKRGFARRGILYKFFSGTASLDQEIRRLTANRRDIMLYILRMSNRSANLRQSEKDLGRRFQCPVVILEDPLPA